MTFRSFRRFPSRWLYTAILFLLSASACSPAPTPTPFRPPTVQAPLIEPTLIINPTKEVVVIQSTPLPTIIATVDPQECSNNLTYISDLTIPDNSLTSFGASIDKQWLVQNTGTCNWNANFRLKHIGGAALGAPEELPFIPPVPGPRPPSKSISPRPLKKAPTRAPGRPSTRMESNSEIPSISGSLFNKETIMAETYSVNDHFINKDPSVRALYDQSVSASTNVRPGRGRPQEDIHSSQSKIRISRRGNSQGLFAAQYQI